MANRKRYIVQSKGTYEGFTAEAIESMKKLNLIRFVSTSRTNDGVTYKYTPVVQPTTRQKDKLNSMGDDITLGGRRVDKNR